jgi:hypothetical protein
MYGRGATAVLLQLLQVLLAALYRHVYSKRNGITSTGTAAAT